MGIPRNLYYRMDAILEHDGFFIWNTKTVLLDNAKTKYARLVGLLGFTESNGHRVYVPIQVNKADDQALQIKLVASTTIKALKWRLRGKTDFKSIPGSFTSGRAIPITLPKNLTSGEYTLEVLGKRRDGVTKISKTIDIKI